MDSLRLSIPTVADLGDLLPDYYRIAWAPGEDGYVYGADFLASAPDYSSVLLALSARCWVAFVLLRLPVSSFPSSPLNESVMVHNVAILLECVVANQGRRFVPSDWRPAIWVRVLPALENILYGANISNILSAHQNVALDVLAWIPYGLCHYGAPFVVSAIMFVFGPPGTVPLYARTLGYISMTAVAIQLLFPCSPPWYENLYGLAPADYSMQGNPAGLGRIDKLLGIDLYTSGFRQSPVVFGAFPSLHAADSTLAALFMSQIFPRLKPLWVTYTLWMWWATMYLSHHYAVDLVGGGLLATIAFYFAKTRFLPRMQKDKMYRWDYDYVEIGDAAPGYGYGLANLGDLSVDSDEWTVGSSSSFSSGSLSPVDGHYSWESDSLVSPGSDLEAGRHHIVSP